MSNTSCGNRAARADGSRSKCKIRVGGHAHPGCGMPYRNPIGGDLAKPAALSQALQLGGSGVAREQDTGARFGSAQRQDLAGVRIGGTLLGEQVVAVVPERDQTKIMNRRVRGGSIPDHDAHLPTQRRQEGSISSRWTGLGHQHGKTAGTEKLRAGFAESIEISLVGHHDHCAAPAVGTGPCGTRQAESPIAAGRRTWGYLP